MTRTGRTLEEYMDMGAAGKVALISFIENLPIDSALGQAINPKDEYGIWYKTLKTNAILADIYDLLQVIHADICALGGNKKKKITPYPRPGTEEKNKRIGSGAIPANKLREWIKERQAHGRRSAH